MSNVSTNLSMNGFKLFTESEVLTCSIFNVKLFVLFIVILVLLSCFSTITQSLFGDTNTYNCGCKTSCKCNDNCETGCGCKCKVNVEQFGNDKFYSYKDTVYPNYTNYQSAALTSLDESLNFGQANRYVKASDDGSKPIEFMLDIYCNLYLLNANPFGMDSIISKPVKQTYIAYLRKNDNRKLIGQLKANSDQVYKLKFKSDKPQDFVNFNNIDIVYSGPDSKETTIMSGRFTVA